MAHKEGVVVVSWFYLYKVLLPLLKRTQKVVCKMGCVTGSNHASLCATLQSEIYTLERRKRGK